ncbi:MAG: ATP-dependent DNA ligase [Acidimicrobiales bacterium]
MAPGPPIEPMLAKLVAELPVAPGLLYEPKWDGFRSIVLCSAKGVELSSRNGRSLTRYFPELIEVLRSALGGTWTLDGEIVIVRDSGLDFEALLQRIHPAQSRVVRLARETPSSFVAFDLLALGSADVSRLPFGQRRAMLQELLSSASSEPHLQITPQTDDVSVAADWLERFEGAGLDGVVAKDPSLPYAPGKRVMWKIKHQRSADCVVAGYREHKAGGVGSLVLGLHDREGRLHHVGVCSGFSLKRRADLVGELAPLLIGPGDPHPWRDHQGTPPTPSRWKSEAELAMHLLEPRLVCEVAYDHRQGDRFRHATSFLRWRPEREAASCGLDQLEVVPPVEVTEVLGS